MKAYIDSLSDDEIEYIRRKEYKRFTCLPFTPFIKFINKILNNSRVHTEDIDTDVIIENQDQTYVVLLNSLIFVNT